MEAAGGRRLPASPRVRRALRHGPRAGVRTRPAGHPADEAAEPGARYDGPGARALVEWHEMTPGELITEWAGLRAWVAWLHGRYELSVEERLPPCWTLHPGLVEELHALRAWREEIYGTGQAGMGQAARYWHAELRATIQAATTMWAAGCRTGHRGAPELARIPAEFIQRWGGGYPLAGVPEIDIAAGQARGTDGWASADAVAAALDDGAAVPIPGSGLLLMDGATWAPAAGGWVRVPAIGSATTAAADRSAGEEIPAWMKS
jgi:hypothetical protein